MPLPTGNPRGFVAPPHFENLEERLLLTTLHGGDTFIYYNSQGDTVRVDLHGAWTDTIELFARDVAMDVRDGDSNVEGIVDLPGIFIDSFGTLLRTVPWPTEPIWQYDDGTPPLPNWIEYQRAAGQNPGARGARTEIYAAYVAEASPQTVLTFSTLALGGTALDGERWYSDIDPWGAGNLPIVGQTGTGRNVANVTAPSGSGGVLIGGERSAVQNNAIRHVAVTSDAAIYPEAMGAFPGGALRPGFTVSDRLFAVLNLGAQGLGANVQSLAVNTSGSFYAVDMNAFRASLVSTASAANLGSSVSSLAADGLGTFYSVNNAASVRNLSFPNFGANVQSLAIDPVNGDYYVVAESGANHVLRSWDGAGALQTIGVLQDRIERTFVYRDVTAMDFNPVQNALYGIATVVDLDTAVLPAAPAPAGPFLIIIDRVTGRVDRGPLVAISNIPAMAFDANGTLYAVNGATNDLVTINLTPPVNPGDLVLGAVTVVAPLTLAGAPLDGVTGIDFIGQTLYGVTALGAYRINRGTGVATDLGVTGLANATSLAYDDIRPGELYSIVSGPSGYTLAMIVPAASLAACDTTGVLGDFMGLFDGGQRHYGLTNIRALDYDEVNDLLVATGQLYNLDPVGTPAPSASQVLLRINPFTGQVSVGAVPRDELSQPLGWLSSLAVDPWYNTKAYAIDSTTNQLRIVNLGSGASTYVSDLPANMVGIDFAVIGSNDRALFGVTNADLYAISPDVSNPGSILLGSTGRTDLTSLTFDTDNPYTLWTTALYVDPFSQVGGYRLASIGLSSTLVTSNAVTPYGQIGRLFDSVQPAYTYDGVTGLDFDSAGYLNGVATLVNIDPYNLAVPPLGATGPFLVRINTTSAQVQLGPLILDAPSVSSLAYGSNGLLYAADATNNRLVTVNASSGATTVVGPFGVAGIVGIDFAADGQMYAVTAGQLYRIDPTTGQATLVANLGLTGGMVMTSLAADPVDPTLLYTTMFVSGAYQLVKVVAGSQNLHRDVDTVVVAGTVAGRLESLQGSFRVIEMGFLWGNVAVGKNVGALILREGGGARPGANNTFLIPAYGSQISVNGTLGMLDSRGGGNQLYSAVLVSNDPTVPLPPNAVKELETSYDPARDFPDSYQDAQWILGELVDYDNDSMNNAQFLTSPSGQMTLTGSLSYETVGQNGFDEDWYGVPLMAGQTIVVDGSSPLLGRFYWGFYVRLYDPEGRWIDSQGLDTVEDWGVGSRGVTTKPMTFTAPTAGIYYLTVSAAHLFGWSYTLTLTGLTRAALGALVVTGNFAGRATTASGAHVAVMNGGVLGAVSVSGTVNSSRFYSSGNLVAFKATQIGPIVNGFYTPCTIQSSSSIGRVAATGGVIDADIIAGMTFLTPGDPDAAIQHISATYLAPYHTISATGNIGIIEVSGDLLGVTIAVNSDNSAVPGHLDLIEIGGGWGGVDPQSGFLSWPSVTHGPNGDIGYVYVTGLIYVSYGAWSGPLQETLVTDGSTSVLNDDGGGRLTVRPVRVPVLDANGNPVLDANGQPVTMTPSYSYAMIPVDDFAGGVGGIIANLRVAGSVTLASEGLVQIGNLDLAGPPGAGTSGGPTNVTFNGTGKADVYYVQGGGTIGSFVNRTQGDLVSGQLSAVTRMELGGDLGPQVGTAGEWIFGHDVSASASFGWYHNRVNGLTVNGDLGLLRVAGFVHDLQVSGTLQSATVNSDGVTVYGSWDGVRGVVWSGTQIAQIDVGDGLADDGPGQWPRAAILSGGSITSVTISGPRRVVDGIVYGELNGSILATTDATQTIIDPVTGQPMVVSVPSIGRVAGTEGAVLTAIVGGMALDSFRADFTGFSWTGSVGTIDFSDVGAAIYGAEIIGIRVDTVSTSADSNGISYSFISGNAPTGALKPVNKVLAGGPGLDTVYISTNGGPIGSIAGVGSVADIKNSVFVSTNGLDSIKARDFYNNNIQMPGTVGSITVARDMYNNGTVNNHPLLPPPDVGVGAMGRISVGGNFRNNIFRVAGTLESLIVKGSFINSTLRFSGPAIANLKTLDVTGNISGLIYSAGKIGSIISRTGSISANISTNAGGWSGDLDLIQTARGFTGAGTLNVGRDLGRFISGASLGSNPATTPGHTTQMFVVGRNLGTLQVGAKKAPANLYADFSIGGSLGAATLYGVFYSNLDVEGDLGNLTLTGSLGGWLDYDGNGTLETRRGRLDVLGQIRSMKLPANADLLADLSVGGTLKSLSLKGASIYGQVQSRYGAIGAINVKNGSIFNSITGRTIGSITVSGGNINGNIRATAGNIASIKLSKGNLNGNVTADYGTIDALTITKGSALAGKTLSAGAGFGKVSIKGNLASNIISGSDISSLTLAVSNLTGLVYAQTNIGTLSIPGNVLNAVIRAGGSIGTLTVGKDVVNSTISAGWNIASAGINGKLDHSYVLAGAGYGLGPNGVPGGGDDVSRVGGTAHSGTIGAVNIKRTMDSSVVAAGIDPGADANYRTFGNNVESPGISNINTMKVKGGFANPQFSAILAASNLDGLLAAQAGLSGVLVYDNAHGGAPLPIGAAGLAFGPDNGNTVLSVGGLTLTLTGRGLGTFNPGTGQLVLNNTALGSALSLAYTDPGAYANNIDITGADDCGLGSLTVTGAVTVGDVRLDGPLGTLSAANVKDGANWTLSGGASTVWVGALTNANVTAADVGAWTVGGRYAAGAFNVDSLGGLTVRGRMGASLGVLLGNAGTINVAGNLSGNVTVRGDLGVLNVSSGAVSGAVTVTNGDLGQVTVAGGVTGTFDVPRGRARTFTVSGGDFGGGPDTHLYAAQGIGTLSVQSGNFTGLATTQAGFGALSVSGTMSGRAWAGSTFANVNAGSMNGAVVAASWDLQRVAVAGAMVSSYLLAGFQPAWAAADALPHAGTGSINSVTVGGDMTASGIGAAVTPGVDGLLGSGDDIVAGRGYVYNVTVSRGIYGSGVPTESYGIFASSQLPNVHYWVNQPFSRNGNARSDVVAPNQ